jgi:hypothetical protein
MKLMLALKWCWGRSWCFYWIEGWNVVMEFVQAWALFKLGWSGWGIEVEVCRSGVVDFFVSNLLCRNPPHHCQGSLGEVVPN